MKIYNTLTRRKEEFVPLEGGKGKDVRMRDHGIGRGAHRTRFSRQFSTIFSANFWKRRVRSDVCPQLYGRRRQDHCAFQGDGDPADEYAKMMIKKIDAVMARADVGEPTLWLKATENIGNIISFVQALIEGGHAYPAANGDVYFDVDAFPAYGQLSGRDKEDALDGVRVDNDEEKKNPYDFALWKAAKAGEICWDSPWGKGRPAGTLSARR